MPRPRRLAVLALLLLAACVGLRGTGYHYRPLAPPTPPAVEAAAPGAFERLRAEQKKLLAAQRRAIPQESYVVIDQTNNRLYVKRGDDVLIEAVCSAGSGMVLREGTGRGREWVFDTPRGAFRVLQRLENPVWRKPDWAFVEEGRPIPQDPSERLEYGFLGEYALYFGNGYMVHGTLYERLLGRSVTHGCIRLGRDDLRAVWKATRIGTPIFIY